jgi:hypothetical protein
MTESEHVGSFVGVTEDGDPITIHIHQEYVVSTTRGGTSRKPSFQSLVTEDGIHVNREAKGVYETSCGLKITSDDPNAP